MKTKKHVASDINRSTSSVFNNDLPVITGAILPPVITVNEFSSEAKNPQVMDKNAIQTDISQNPDWYMDIKNYPFITEWNNTEDI